MLRLIGRKLRRAVVVCALASLVLPAAASARGESFKALLVTATGCNSGAFTLLVERANLDGGTYTVRTLVQAARKSYMNEAASITVNGQTPWTLFQNFSYGPMPNRALWPIPKDRRMRIDFRLERPKGTVLYAWSTVVDSCNDGVVLYNGLTAADADRDLVPVPTDRCPKLRAATANGCPARTLALGYDRLGQRFVGWLTAKGFPTLYRARRVTVWRLRPGADRRIGRTTTTRRGRYVLPHRRRPGTFYATTPAVWNVPREISSLLRLR